MIIRTRMMMTGEMMRTTARSAMPMTTWLLEACTSRTMVCSIVFLPERETRRWRRVAGGARGDSASHLQDTFFIEEQASPQILKTKLLHFLNRNRGAPDLKGNVTLFLRTKRRLTSGVE